MVKNTTGGSKHKSQARKNIVGRNTNSALRVVQQEGECYGQVEKILGGPHMHVACMDGKLRLCTIRGKFRGRGKRDNRLGTGTWVMVGLRDYETVKETTGTGTKVKLENCDLLEVYKDSDKERLSDTVRSEDWSKFKTRDLERSHFGKDDVIGDTLCFVTEKEIEIDELVAASKDLVKEDKAEDDKIPSNKIIGSSLIVSGGGDDDDIDIDDI
jgi:initiation factor 1A